eukprot:scaffold13254_cov51-Phaeocystis_antarctica.AAC.2
MSLLLRRRDDVDSIAALRQVGAAQLARQHGGSGLVVEVVAGVIIGIGAHLPLVAAVLEQQLPQASSSRCGGGSGGGGGDVATVMSGGSSGSGGSELRLSAACGVARPNSRRR